MRTRGPTIASFLQQAEENLALLGAQLHSPVPSQPSHRDAGKPVASATTRGLGLGTASFARARSAPRSALSWCKRDVEDTSATADVDKTLAQIAEREEEVRGQMGVQARTLLAVDRRLKGLEARVQTGVKVADLRRLEDRLAMLQEQDFPRPGCHAGGSNVQAVTKLEDRVLLLEEQMSQLAQSRRRDDSRALAPAEVVESVSVSCRPSPVVLEQIEACRAHVSRLEERLREAVHGGQLPVLQPRESQVSREDFRLFADRVHWLVEADAARRDELKDLRHFLQQGPFAAAPQKAPCLDAPCLDAGRQVQEGGAAACGGAPAATSERSYSSWREASCRRRLFSEGLNERSESVSSTSQAAGGIRGCLETVTVHQRDLAGVVYPVSSPRPSLGVVQDPVAYRSSPRAGGGASSAGGFSARSPSGRAIPAPLARQDDFAAKDEISSVARSSGKAMSGMDLASIVSMMGRATDARSAERASGGRTPSVASALPGEAGLPAPQNGLQAMAPPRPGSSSATELEFAGAPDIAEAFCPGMGAAAPDNCSTGGFDPPVAVAAFAPSSSSSIPAGSLQSLQHGRHGHSSSKSSAAGLGFAPPPVPCRWSDAPPPEPCRWGEPSGGKVAVPHGSDGGSHGRGLQQAKHCADTRSLDDETLRDAYLAAEVPAPHGDDAASHGSGLPQAGRFWDTGGQGEELVLDVNLASEASPQLQAPCMAPPTPCDTGAGIEGITAAGAMGSLAPSPRLPVEGTADAVAAAMAAEVESACSSSAHAVACEAAMAAADAAESQSRLDGAPSPIGQPLPQEIAADAMGFLDSVLDDLMNHPAQGPNLMGDHAAAIHTGTSNHIFGFAGGVAGAGGEFTASVRHVPAVSVSAPALGGDGELSDSLRDRRRANDTDLKAFSASSSDVGTIELP